MLKNYFKIAARNFMRFKSYTVINIVGLTVGLTCAVLIMIWVDDELGMDNYHSRIDNIYQANLKWSAGGVTGYQGTVAPVVGTILRDEYAEIADVVRVGILGEVVLKTPDKMILETNGIGAEPSIFKIFTFPLLRGDPESALAEPHSIVLAESMARKYFGNEDPVGRTIRLNNKADLVVTGVMKEVPRNTSGKFDFVVPFAFLKELGYDTRGSLFFPCQYLTYVLLKENVSSQLLSDKIEKRIYSSGKMATFSICLLPFKNAYLRETDGLNKITVLSLIALFILVIACINFINLATARSSIRRKEIGIRKVSGANRFQISGQFLMESTLLVGISTLVSLALTDQLLVLLNRFTGKTLAIPYADSTFILGLLGLVVFTGICAGIYPALYLSRFKPAEIFQKQSLRSGRSILRKGLIVFQFALSISFIVSAVVMSRQANFINNFDLGVNQYNIVYVNLEGDVRNKYDLVRSELLKNPSISHVTSASTLPIAIVEDSYFKWGRNDNVGRKIYPTDVSYGYLETFGLKMADGRFYSKDHPGDAKGSIVVNEAAIRTIGMESPVGKPFYFDGAYYTLIGTLKDFHFNKLLYSRPEPLVLKLVPGGSNYLFAKIDPHITDRHKVAGTREYIQNVCNRFSPERPLQSRFLSDFSFDLEKSNEAMRTIVFCSAILAVLISGLGLLGLSMFVSQQKTKEIGIRKTLGASIPGILSLLSKEFLKWVLLANLFAWPAAYFVMNNWLHGFAYRIDPAWWMFVLSGVVALVIALVTISWQAIRAATANPVEALRYE